MIAVLVLVTVVTVYDVKCLIRYFPGGIVGKVIDSFVALTVAESVLVGVEIDAHDVPVKEPNVELDLVGDTAHSIKAL